MTIEHDHHIPALLHPAWCAPACHTVSGDEHDPYDRWHRTEAHGFDTVGSREFDLDRVEVTVERSDHRDFGTGEWRPTAPTVLLSTLREAGSDLTPQEARRAARLLLAAADLAEGVTVTW